MGKDRLSTYGLDRSDEWDAVVRTFEDHDTYWLSGYVRAFALHGDGEPLMFHYEGADGTRGVNVAMLRDVADDGRFDGLVERGRYRDLTSPYGYGGWLVEGDGTDGLFATYERWCRRSGVVSEFVRFHPMVANQAACGGFYDVVPMGQVVHMDLSSPADIWSNMTGKNRNMVRKARKAGVRVYNGRFPEAYRAFKAIYDSTMERDGADPYYYFGEGFYASVLEDLPCNAQVFWAEIEGKTIAASIMLACNGMMDYHLSGSLREYSSLAATNLILYEAALWGCENGCRTLYLGGGVGSGEDSLFRFKRSFYKGDLKRFLIGRRVFLQEEYDELVEARERCGEPIPDGGFFPRYRA